MEEDIEKQLDDMRKSISKLDAKYRRRVLMLEWFVYPPLVYICGVSMYHLFFA
jgi:hypothetical protein